MLAHVKDSQHDIEGVRQDRHGHEGFKYPLEEHPCVYVMEVVPVYEHLNELIGHDEREDNPSDWQNDRFRYLPYHGKDPGVKIRRGRPNLRGNPSDLLIHVVEKAVQISHDTIYKHTLEPFHDCIDDSIHISLL